MVQKYSYILHKLKTTPVAKRGTSSRTVVFMALDVSGWLVFATGLDGRFGDFFGRALFIILKHFRTRNRH